MHRTRSTRRVGAWLALLSLCLLALAPTLARLHAAVDPLAWVPVCTTQGLQQGQTAADGRALPNPAEQLRGGDSLFLALQGALPGLPATEQTAGPALLPGDAPTVASAATPRTAAPWAGAQARAPPAA